MTHLGQFAAVTTMNLRALPQRLGPSAVAVFGIAGVVLILVAVLSVSEGFRRALELAGSDRVAIVLPNGPEMATAFLSVASAATSAPLNPAYRQEDFEFYMEDI